MTQELNKQLAVYVNDGDKTIFAGCSYNETGFKNIDKYIDVVKQALQQIEWEY